jgi:hypothetical protein
MRALILASSVGLAFVASAQAVPLAPNPVSIELGAAHSVELVRDGCGRGWHRDSWRDQSGDWHWGHCIPNGSPHDAWTARWAHGTASVRLELTIEVKGASVLARQRS